MQETPRLDFGSLEDNIAITPARSCSNNVLVERERDEGYQDQKVYRGCNGTHGLWTVANVSQTAVKRFALAREHISFLTGLLMSLPLRPALMNVGPSHRMRT